MEPEKLGSAETIKIHKLKESKFHVWKQKMDLFNIYCKVY